MEIFDTESLKHGETSDLPCPPVKRVDDSQQRQAHL